MKPLSQDVVWQELRLMYRTQQLVENQRLTLPTKEIKQVKLGYPTFSPIIGVRRSILGSEKKGREKWTKKMPAKAGHSTISHHSSPSCTQVTDIIYHNKTFSWLCPTVSPVIVKN